MFVASLINYFGLGCERKHNPDGSWCLSLIKMKLGKYDVILEQDQSAISMSDRPEGMIHTTTLNISGVRSYSEGEKVVHDICSLLSLAAMSQVRAYHFEFEDKIRHVSDVGECLRFRPLIETVNGDSIKSFIEKSWPKYRRLKRSRKLPEVVDMLTTCELPKLPLEIQLGQIFIILENLKSTYANFSKIPFVKGFYREISDPPKANPKNERRLSFEALLHQMFCDVGMHVSLKRVVNLRNEIVHFGLSRKPYESLRKNYDFCHDIVREYLLRLLGYKGEYLIYSKACRQVGCI